MNIQIIEKKVDYTLYVLNYFSGFNSQNRKHFNLGLQHLRTFLSKDAQTPPSPGQLWFTAHRIVSLDRLYTKIESISDKILKKSTIPFFSGKIRNRILPSLSQRIEEIKQSLFHNQKLPFSKGINRNKFYQGIQRNLQLQNSTGISYVETEYVHLVGNHLTDEEIKPIDIACYEGSFEIYSLSSWMHVLSLFKAKGNISEQIVCMKLIDRLKNAKSLFLKTTYAPKVFHNAPVQNQKELEKAYIAEIEKAYDPKASQTALSVAKYELLCKYNLDKPISIPKSVLYNEIIWEILESIDKLNEGNSTIFALGVKDHCIMIELLCHKKGILGEKENYEYKIFNTGYGAVTYHTLNEEKTRAYPLTFQKLPKGAFNYAFFSELAQLAVSGEDIHQFYQHHESFLVDNAGGKKMTAHGKLYPIQKLGTCCYTAMEAWIRSYFTDPQIHHLESVKIQMSTEKQEKVIKMLSSDNMDGVASKKRKAAEDSPNAPPTKKFKDSQLLYELGKKLLNRNS